MNTQLTGTARVAADPELRFTPNGKAVCELRLAFSNSTRDRQTDKYVDSPPIWVSCTLWSKMAENAVESIRRGDEVVASGVLEMEVYAKRDGTRGEKLVLKMAEVAPSIRRSPLLRDGMIGSDTRPAAGRDQAVQVGRPQGRPQPVQNVPPPADPWAGDAPPF